MVVIWNDGDCWTNWWSSVTMGNFNNSVCWPNQISTIIPIKWTVFCYRSFHYYLYSQFEILSLKRKKIINFDKVTELINIKFPNYLNTINWNKNRKIFIQSKLYPSALKNLFHLDLKLFIPFIQRILHSKNQ